MIQSPKLVAGSFAILTVISMSLATGPALGQAQLQTPDGRQTLPPSRMKPQPGVGEALRQNPEQVPAGPGNEYKSPQEPNAGSVRLPGTGDADTGGGQVLQGPGIPSDIRIGPVEPVPFATRVILGILLVFNLLMITAWAVAQYLLKKRRDAVFNDGHVIQRGHKERLVSSAPGEPL